jgi:hypothetical protein
MGCRSASLRYQPGMERSKSNITARCWAGGNQSGWFPGGLNHGPELGQPGP